MIAPYHETAHGTLYHGDCLEVMKQFEDKSFDLCLTDPPYGISMDKHAHKKGISCKANGFKPHLDTNWDNPITMQHFDGIYRVSKNQIIWGANYYPQFLFPSMCWIFWNKMQPNFSFSDGEFAFTSFWKKARVFNWARGNESGFAPCGCDAPNQHPTQKPVKLFEWCLINYSKEGMSILDPFAGSGTTAIACIRTGRRYVMIEKEEKYCDIAARRIETELDQMDFLRSEK